MLIAILCIPAGGAKYKTKIQNSGTSNGKEKKRKEEYLYSAFSHQSTYKALRHG